MSIGVTPEVASTGLLASLTKVDGASVSQGRAKRWVEGALSKWLGLLEERQDSLLGVWDSQYLQVPSLFLFR